MKKDNFQLTVYKFSKIQDLKNLSNTLSNKIIGVKEEINNQVIEFNKNVKILYFSYINKNTGIEIEWFQKWKKFFELENGLRSASATGHGAIIIELTKTKEQYLLTFGRSYSLLKEFIIPNYGIKIAEKLFNGKSIDSVSSKYFSLTKNKSIISYTQEAIYDFEEGEAADLLKSVISVNSEYSHSEYITDLLKLVKPLATIGYTNVKLTISKENITLNDIVDVITLLSNIEKNCDNQMNIPQMKPAPKATEQELNKRLFDAIKSKEGSVVFSVPFFNKGSDDYYHFLDSIDSVLLKFGRKSQARYENFCVNDLFAFIESNPSIESLDSIRCEIINDQNHKEEPNIYKWLEAQIDIDGDTYALHNGKWYSFNDDYLNRVNDRIKEIENFEPKVIQVDASFSAIKDDVEKFCYKNKENIVKLFSDSGDSEYDKLYKEFKYNYYLSRKNDWNLFDRCINGSVELCDISVPNEAFIHCKIGSSGNLEECLRQSMISLTYFTQNAPEIEAFKNREEKELTSPKEIIVLYLTDGALGTDYKISQLRSLKCKLTFLNWYNYCVSRKYTPKLIVAQYK